MVLIEEASNKDTLFFRDLFLLLLTEKIFALGLVIVLELNAVKYPIIVFRYTNFRAVQVLLDALDFLVSDLADRDTSTALALAEVVVALPVDSGAGVSAAAVALADETLTHAEILISLVTSFCEPNPCELIHLFKVLHEGA